MRLEQRIGQVRPNWSAPGRSAFHLIAAGTGGIVLANLRDHHARRGRKSTRRIRSGIPAWIDDVDVDQMRPGWPSAARQLTAEAAPAEARA